MIAADQDCRLCADLQTRPESLPVWQLTQQAL
jgi:hypothetical protein